MSDIEACKHGIAALKRLYGGCEERHYEPDCISCVAGRLIRSMQDLLEQLRKEGCG